MFASYIVYAVTFFLPFTIPFWIEILWENVLLHTILIILMFMYLVSGKPRAPTISLPRLHNERPVLLKELTTVCTLALCKAKKLKLQTFLSMSCNDPKLSWLSQQQLLQLMDYFSCLSCESRCELRALPLSPICLIEHMTALSVVRNRPLLWDLGEVLQRWTGRRYVHKWKPMSGVIRRSLALCFAPHLAFISAR